MNTDNKLKLFLQDSFYPEIDFDVILNGTEGWFEEWARFFQLAFQEAGYHYKKPARISALSELFLECRKWSSEDVQQWLAGYDRDTHALANYLLGPVALHYAMLRDRQHLIQRRTSSLNEKRRNPKSSEFVELESTLADSKAVDLNHDPNSLEGIFRESELFDTIKKNLNQYVNERLQDSNDVLSQQATFQLYMYLETAQEPGIQKSVDWLLGVVERCSKLNEEPTDLLRYLHSKAHKEYQRNIDEYSERCRHSGKKTKTYRKYEKKQLKSTYYQLFCPLRDKKILKNLLGLSESCAYQHPSRYRREFLRDVLLPEFKQKLDELEGLNAAESKKRSLTGKAKKGTGETT